MLASRRAVAIACSLTVAGIRHAAVEDVRHEIGRPALDLVRLPGIALEQGGAGRACGGDVHVGAGQLEHLADADSAWCPSR